MDDRIGNIRIVTVVASEDDLSSEIHNL